MTKFDIFVVNLKRSVDRREAMREKIARIRGFKEIYIDGELVCGKNSSLGMQFRTCENFGDFADSKSSLNPQNSHKYKSHTANTRIVDSNKSDSNDSSESSLRENERSEFSWQSTHFCDSKNSKNQSARSATLKALSGAGVGVVREGEGSDFAIQAPTPSLKENAHSQKWEFNADLSAESRKEIDSRFTLDSRDLDSSRCRAQNDDNFILRHSEGAKRPKNPQSNSESFLDSLQYYTKNDKISMDSQNITLHFHFFPATDATDFKNEKSPLPPQYSSKLTRFVKGKDLSFGEMACFSSHYRLWQKCVALDSPIIVLEDDIDFMQDFCQIIEIFKSPFEYVRLYYLFDRKITHLYDRFYISFGNVSGAQGYYLTPQAAQKFIKNARFWLFCVDDYMDMFFIHSVKNIIFKPFIISEDLDSATQSTISGREKPQMRFYQKLTRELSRIYFFAIRKYLYFALHFVEIRAFFRANRR